MTIPLSDARLHLKQVDVSVLGALEQTVFTNVLSAYGLEIDESATSEHAAWMREQFRANVVIDPSPSRRFAGDRSLPRTRYFALVGGGGGSDGSTLRREMSAYLMRCAYPGLVSLFDSGLVNDLELLGVLADIPERNYRALDLDRPSLLIAVRPINGDPLLRELYGAGPQYVIQVPYEIAHRQVEGFLDLRELAARDWLVAQFNGSQRIGDREFPVLINRKRLRDFPELLPSLLEQWLGGGWTTGNIAGAFARRAGAAGLVYPSARANAMTELHDGVVRASAGWCFVSYQDAPPMELTHVFSMESGLWPAQPGWSPVDGHWIEEPVPIQDSAIEYVRQGPQAGSFTVRGVAEYNQGRYRLAQVLAALRAVDPGAGTEAAEYLGYLAMYSSAENLRANCVVFIRALLGDALARSALADRTTSVDSEIEQEAYAAVLRLVDAVPGSFHASGPLAQGLGIAPRQP